MREGKSTMDMQLVDLAPDPNVITGYLLTSRTSISHLYNCNNFYIAFVTELYRCNY